MRIISFVNGVRAEGVELGLVGVPHFVNSMAKRGHFSCLAIGGGRIPTLPRGFDGKVDGWLFSPEYPNFRVLTFIAWSFWCIAPGMLKLSSEVRKADVVMLHSLYSFPVLIGYLLARWHRKPYLFFPHGVLAPFQRLVSWKKKAIYDKFIARRIMEGASAIIYSALGEREETVPLNLTAPSVVIPEGIAVNDYAAAPAKNQFRARYLSGYNGPLVLYLGRLSAKKGLDLLAQAMGGVAESLPGVRLAIVGPGDSPSFEYQVAIWLKECNLEKCTVMTGAIMDLEEKKQAYADAEVFVLPSCAENFGHVIFEAMASRVPVVISDTLNYADEVRREEAGIVVRRTPEEFAAAILKLLGDAPLRRRLGENGYRLAQKYSWEKTGERLEEAIQCILQGRPFPVDLNPT